MHVKSICVVGIVGIPANYGGFETLVENLTLRCEGRFLVYCSSLHYDDKRSQHNQARLVYIPLPANGPLSVIYDLVCIAHALLTGERNLLVLGVSGAVCFPLLARVPGIKIVTNLDGVEWQRKKWGGFAKRFLRLSERLAVRFSDVVVADNKAIADYVSREYGVDCKSIAYGGDHACVQPEEQITDNRLASIEYFALSICRIEPENNVELALKAFSELSLNLIVVGNWDNSQYGMELRQRFARHSNLILLDPIYGDAQLYYLRSRAALYVHGHSAGGTNPSLVEMMHFGVPVAAYDCVFNRHTTEGRASYFKTPSQLKELVSVLQGGQGDEIGQVMREIATREYTWSGVSAAYMTLFN